MQVSILNSLFGKTRKSICIFPIKNSGTHIQLDGVQQIKLQIQEDTPITFYCNTESGLIGGYLFESNGERVRLLNDFPLTTQTNLHYGGNKIIQASINTLSGIIKKRCLYICPIFISLFLFVYHI